MTKSVLVCGIKQNVFMILPLKISQELIIAYQVLIHATAGSDSMETQKIKGQTH